MKFENHLRGLNMKNTKNQTNHQNLYLSLVIKHFLVAGIFSIGAAVFLAFRPDIVTSYLGIENVEAQIFIFALGLLGLWSVVYALLLLRKRDKRL